MDHLIIRQECRNDYKQVFALVEAAFRDMKYADGDEQYLVDRIRKSEFYIPELSLVAEQDGSLLGHIMFSRIWIHTNTGKEESLILAPVSVLPEYQGRGIGSRLITEGHHIAGKLGFKSVILVGHENYYPRFGYKRCSNYGIKLPLEVPDENALALELVEGALNGLNGTAEFPPAFF